MDKNLSKLLKWGVENSPTAATSTTAAASPAPASAPAPRSDLTPDILQAILGGPSDADLMVAAMQVVRSADPDVSLDNRLVAFDNFEHLIESLDNANNLENLALWTPLLECLGHEEKAIRLMAAWCVGTAVQNNIKTQERLLAMGRIGIPALVGIATAEQESADVKKKALYALSSACRNCQPTMDLLSEELGRRGLGGEKTDATDMEAVSKVIDSLRQ